MIYQFRKGFAIRNVDAQTVGDELYRIRKVNDDRLTPEAVVKSAAEGDSAIHNCFTWDTEKAAYLHNLSEARTLIKSVVIVQNGKRAIPKPAYFNVTVAIPDETEAAEKSERYYQLTTEMEYGSLEYRSAVNSALRELSSALMTVQQLWDMAPKGKRMLFERVKGLVRNARELLIDMLPPKDLE